MTDPADPFPAWLASLEDRHLRDLTFRDVRRALQALSSVYVERRRRITRGGALDGAGKRAAFALFYGPLHFLVTRHVIRGLGADAARVREVVDLGCGTGAASAAWALEAGPGTRIDGIDLHPWAVAEARWTWRRLGLRGRASRGRLERRPLPGRPAGVLAAWAVNELPEATRDELLPRLVDAARRGAAVLVIEPVATRLTPWWPAWSEALAEAGARDDLWRLPEAPPPGRLDELDRAAGLNHRRLKARSLFVPAGAGDR